MIKIICIGNLKEGYLKDACQEYQKRLQKYTKLEIIEIPEIKAEDKKTILSKEKEKIKTVLKPKDNLVLLDINGKEYSSEDFAKKFEKELIYHNNITFLIGSSYGVAESLKQEIPKKISFSKLTFPHQLFRVLLLEQIYRSYKIINHEEYHK